MHKTLDIINYIRGKKNETQLADIAIIADSPNGTEDTVYLQSLIDLIPADGGKIFLTTGIYIIEGLVLPNDRVVVFEGQGQMLIEGAVPLLNGTVIQRKTGYTGAMFTQTGDGAFAKGAQFYSLSISGNSIEGNCFEIDWVNVMQFDKVTFHRIDGHALRLYGLFNSWFRSCRFYGCGNLTYEAVLLDGSLLANSASAGVHFIDCSWENSMGTDIIMTREHAPATAGTTDIKISGGKIEQSLSSPPEVPLVKVEATSHSEIKTLFANGKSNDATHLVIGGTENSFILGLGVDSQFVVSDTSELLNPEYLVHVKNHASGDVMGVTIKGYFRRGGANTGAQIKVEALESTVLSRVFVDPLNVYYATFNKVIDGVFGGVNSYEEITSTLGGSIAYGLNGETIELSGNLATNKNYSLSKVLEGNTNYPPTGATFKITRTGVDVYNMTITNGSGGNTLATLTAGTWGEFKFDGTDWKLVSSGTL